MRNYEAMINSIFCHLKEDFTQGIQHLDAFIDQKARIRILVCVVNATHKVVSVKFLSAVF